MVELSVKYNIDSSLDYFNLLKIIKSPIAQNWKHYAVRYCEGKQFFRVLKMGKKNRYG
jgi:hypothetical protein